MNRNARDQTQRVKRQSESDDLSRFQDVLAKLEAVREVPSPGVEPAAARRRFLNEAAGLWAARERPRLLRRALLPLAAVLALAIGLAGGLIAAAQPAWPATPLYPVKLAWEDLRLTLTADPLPRVELLESLVDERVAEIDRLNAVEEPIPGTVLQRLDRNLGQALKAIAQLPGSQMSPSLLALQTGVAENSQVLERALRSAPPQNRAAIAQGIALLAGARSWITLGLQDPAALGRAAGAAAGFPSLLLPRPTDTVSPGPTRTPERALPTASPTPLAVPTATATAQPSRAPVPSSSGPTAGGDGVSPTSTHTPQTPGPNRTPAKTHTSGPPETSSPAHTSGPTSGPPGQTPQPTHGQRPGG